MAKIMVKLEKSTHYYVMALNAFIYFFSNFSKPKFWLCHDFGWASFRT
jgi:hypothetical protein